MKDYINTFITVNIDEKPFFEYFNLLIFKNKKLNRRLPYMILYVFIVAYICQKMDVRCAEK
jgi:hypothetical protein